MRATKTAPVGRRSVRRAVWGSLLAAVLGLGAAAVPASAGGAVNVPVVHDGAVRSVRLYVPGSLPAGQRVPLLLVLHGLGSAPANVARQTGLDALAERKGFVVAYPEGRWSSWNAGGCCGDAAATGVDDVGFLVRLAGDLALAAPVDTARVYLAGFSNGGMMALRAACERPDVFAAAASVMGTSVSACVPSRPVSVLQVAGGRDTIVPYRGSGFSGLLRSPLPPVTRAAGAWERGDACSGLPSRTRSGKAEVRTYDGCAGDTSVRVVLLPDSVHVWPTYARDGWAASGQVWGFLSARSLPVLSGAAPRPVLATRLAASRVRDGVAGRLDGRYDVVIGARLVVEERRGRGWVAVAHAVTDVEGAFRVRVPGRAPLRVRYAGGPGLPSSAVA